MNDTLLFRERFERLFLDGGIWVDVDRRAPLAECEPVLGSSLISNMYDLLQLEVLTPLVWLKMAPLDAHPLDIFLYHFGRLQLSGVVTRVDGYNSDWFDN